MNLTRIEKRELNKVDLESIRDKPEKMVQEKKMLKSKRCTHNTRICGLHLWQTITLAMNMMMLCW